MSYLYVCNTFSDCISKIDIDKFLPMDDIFFKSSNSDKIGPHGICRYKDKIITADSFFNGISVIDENKKDIKNYFIGMNCSNIITLENNAYITCSDSNDIIVFDLWKKEINELIPCGTFPFSIDIDKNKKLLLVSNMMDDSISVIDFSSKDNSRKIRVGHYPTKALFTSGGEYIIVCESNIGMDSRGSIAVISTKSSQILKRIPVGNCPTGICINCSTCYVSNFGDGTISILNINDKKEQRRINIGGMPKEIAMYDRYIFIADYYNNAIFKIDIYNEDKLKIKVKNEPNGLLIL